MIRKLLLMTAVTVSFLAVIVIVPAASSVSAASSDNCVKENRGFLNFPTWYKYLKPNFDGGECKLTFAFPGDTGKVLLAVVEILLRVAGLVAVGFVIYGGFQYMLYQGDKNYQGIPEKANAARSTIINALIGVVITTVATVAVTFFANNITKT